MKKTLAKLGVAAAVIASAVAVPASAAFPGRADGDHRPSDAPRTLELGDDGLFGLTHPSDPNYTPILGSEAPGGDTGGNGGNAGLVVFDEDFDNLSLDQLPFFAPNSDGQPPLLGGPGGGDADIPTCFLCVEPIADLLPEDVDFVVNYDDLLRFEIGWPQDPPRPEYDPIADFPVAECPPVCIGSNGPELIPGVDNIVFPTGVVEDSFAENFNADLERWLEVNFLDVS